MKKLLLSGIAVFALMTAGSAQAADVDLTGATGVARTPLAMSAAPMKVAIAGDYVFSDDLFVPVRFTVGLPMGIEVGGAYWFMDTDNDPKIWDLSAKYVLPKFVEGLGIAVGGHYNAISTDPDFDANGFDVYGVATYLVPLGEGMTLIPSAGAKYQNIGGDIDESGFKFFGSLLFKMDMFAVGGEIVTQNEDLDFLEGGSESDASYWVGGRFYVNPMITVQAGYLNNANVGGDFKDGVFHAGVQFAFGGAQ
ncbi:MAG TPA: hypothetical protein VI078_11060 [bacterium]